MNVSPEIREAMNLVVAYRTMTAACAAELAAEQKRTFGAVHVWYIPTTATRDGSLIAASSSPHPDARTISPQENGASAYTSWATVPYAEQAHVLHRACMALPILPRHPAKKDT